jgi:hypothetical protein
VSGFNDRRDDRPYRDDRGFEGPDRGPGRRFTEAQAVDLCKDSIRDIAVRRFGTPNIDFRRIALDDNPGRRDWVNGELAVRRRFRAASIFRFSCSVNFDSGDVRTARIDQFEVGSYPPNSYR